MNTENTALVSFNATRQKVNQLLSLNHISPKDIADFTPAQLQYMGEICTKKLGRLKGTERDNFLEKISLTLPATTKLDIWEYNHSLITNTVSQYMREYGAMPPQSEIADQTGLSRQTVAKHLKEFQQHPEFASKMEQFKLMTPNLLANVYRVAKRGDMKATRLYFEMVGAIDKKQTNTVVKEQNNYIQINDTKLSQENLKQLSPKQLNLIESIINNGEYNLLAIEAPGNTKLKTESKMLSAGA